MFSIANYLVWWRPKIKCSGCLPDFSSILKLAMVPTREISAPVTELSIYIETCLLTNPFNFAPWEIFHAFLSFADFFQNQLFKKKNH